MALVAVLAVIAVFLNKKLSCYPVLGRFALSPAVKNNIGQVHAFNWLAGIDPATPLGTTT